MSHVESMNREHRRAAKKMLARDSQKWPEALIEWPRKEWPKDNPEVLRVFRSRGFLVQEYPAPAPAVVRLSVNRAAITSGGHWGQAITWEELQCLKGQAGYGEFDAVEIYPRACDVVNVANMRHLWVMPLGALSFAWRAKP